MSVIVKGMEKPNVCAFCFLDASECDLYPKVNMWRERHPDCPLVELPPHGRLIDKDKLMTEFMDSDLDHLQRDDWREVIQIVEDAETVIEGSETE